jgi:hypothetical protein
MVLRFFGDTLYLINILPTLDQLYQAKFRNLISFEMYMKFSAQKEFNFSDIHIQEVLNKISKLNTSKSVGPDNIPAKLVKDSKDVVAPFLTLIFNASLSNGIFPDDFKIARVSPIHKLETKKNEVIIDLFLYSR